MFLLRPDAVADFSRRLPASDVVVWTDGFVPSPLGAKVSKQLAEDAYLLSSFPWPLISPNQSPSGIFETSPPV